MNNKLSGYSDQELIDIFNREVGNKGWCSARSEHLVSIHNEFNNREFIYKDIGDNKQLKFNKKIKIVVKNGIKEIKVL